MTKPLVSIVIALRDRNTDPMPAIESVFEQTYRPLELIVVEEAAATGAAFTIDALRRAPSQGMTVRIVADESRSGAGLLNAGIAAATGEYIALISTSDRYAPNRLECCLAAAHG